MQIRKPILFSGLAVVIIGIATVWIFWGTKDLGYSVTTKEGFVSDLMDDLGSVRNRQSLIEAYCESTANSQGFGDPQAVGLFYDPSQSLFLGLLCANSDNRDKISDLVKNYDRDDLGLDSCEWDDDMNSCDFSIFIPKIFAIVMNDLSKAKLAQLYSYQGTSTDDAIKSFSDSYFGPGDSMCGSKNAIYIGNTEGGDKEAPCLHPQTRSVLEQYIQQAGQMAEQTKYINAKTLLTQSSDTCEKNSTEFLLCAFDNTNTYARDAFHNTLYNELLFYQLFISITNDRLKYPEYNQFLIYEDTNQKADQEIIRLNQEMMLSREAVMYTEKTLQNMQTSFPIHIGLLAYYEDIITFRKSLLRVYTPIHQLYYKLRNVQQNQ